MVGTYSVSNSGKYPDSNTMIEQIGQKLRNARESKGFSLGQIYDRTKIPPNHLESIENGRFDDLPEPVYVVGFIKRYAECVGLNGQNLVDEYRKQIDAMNEENNKKGIFGIKTGKPSAVQTAPAQAHIHKSTRVAPPAPNFANMVFYPAILIILLSGLISYLFYYQEQQFAMQQDPSVTALRESASRFNTVPSASQSNSGTTNTTSGTPSALPAKQGDAHVSLVASQHVWVEVKSVGTGESMFTGYLESGDRREFTDAQGLKVRAGNGASLNISNNGKNETFGTSGQVVDRVFMGSNAATTATGVPGTTTGGSILGANGTTEMTPAQIKAAKAAKAAAAARKAKATATARKLNDVPDRYVPGEGRGSIGTPYRYTEPESY